MAGMALPREKIIGATKSHEKPRFQSTAKRISEASCFKKSNSLNSHNGFAYKSNHIAVSLFLTQFGKLLSGGFFQIGKM